MSEIKVNKLTPRANCGTTTLGDSGDTFNIPAGVTISNNGTATGFGATGAVNWDVSSIKTVDFTAVSGVGYFVDTATTGAVEVTLPTAPPVGDVVGVADYANNFGTANCTLNRNSLKIGGNTTNAIMATNGVAVTLVYVDVTKGWIVTDSGNQSDAPGPTYLIATGGCITTCGNYKMHTFYSPGTFGVTQLASPAGGPNSVDYLVVAGGGGGGAGATPAHGAGAGGAGGYRESPGTATGCYTVSPLGAAPATALPMSLQCYAVTVGSGGPSGPGCTQAKATSGNDSTFSTITSAGGGGGGGSGYNPSGAPNGVNGGSGGGGGSECSAGIPSPNPAPGGGGGAGNTPPVNPAQGNDGGYGSNGPAPSLRTGGGGGATGNGNDGPAGAPVNGAGGTGGGTAINLTTMPAPSPTPSAQIGTPGPSPSVRYFAGGGGGGGTTGQNTGGTGGYGGGANGVAPNSSGSAGTINTGGGGGGGGGGPPVGSVGTNGGSGIVVIRYRYQ